MNSEEAKRGKNILIIEDEKPMARALRLKLSSAGFFVEAVTNGEAALALMKEKTFDLVILDLIIPKMDGFQLLEKLKAAHVAQNVIIISNLCKEEDVQKALALGAKDFLIKSDVPLAEIVKRVKQLVNF